MKLFLNLNTAFLNNIPSWIYFRFPYNISQENASRVITVHLDTLKHITCVFHMVLQKYKMGISFLGNENVQFLHDARRKKFEVVFSYPEHRCQNSWTCDPGFECQT